MKWHNFFTIVIIIVIVTIIIAVVIVSVVSVFADVAIIVVVLVDIASVVFVDIIIVIVIVLKSVLFVGSLFLCGDGRYGWQHHNRGGQRQRKTRHVVVIDEWRLKNGSISITDTAVIVIVVVLCVNSIG